MSRCNLCLFEVLFFLGNKTNKNWWGCGGGGCEAQCSGLGLAGLGGLGWEAIH